MIFVYAAIAIFAIVVIGVIVSLVAEYWWFFLLCALAVGAIIFLIRKKRKKTQPERTSSRHDYPIVGESHYVDNIESVGQINPDFTLTQKQLFEKIGPEARAYEYIFEPKTAQLVPEPTNKYDPNAIRVDIDGKTVGYIGRGLTSEIHKLLKSGKLNKVEATIIGGRYRHFEPIDKEVPGSRNADYKIRTSSFHYSVSLYLDY